jgi:hypothetical protein
VLLKVRQAYAMYLRMLRLYGIEGLMNQLQSLEPNDISGVIKAIPFSARRERWTNVGGQLIPTSEVNKLRADIGKYKGWNDIHQFYRRQSDIYQRQRNTHAIACLLELGVIDKKTFDVVRLRSLADEALETKRWIMQGILDSRQKDYVNPFRQMVYDTEAEMEQVLGRIDDNAFIQEQQEALMTFTEGISTLLSRLGA